MANCYYKFTFTNSATSDLAVSFSNDGTNWSTYNEPAFPPSPQNRGNVLQVNYGDSVSVWLSGPAGWSLTGQLQVIIARANSAPSGQPYSPFSGGAVWMNPQGGWVDTSDNPPYVWGASLGQVATNPGQGRTQNYEITIAFNAQLPGASGPTYFAEDPEMDVQGM
jgi:hypothetical protein